MKKHIFFLALNAIIAAIYAAFTIFISPIAYGAIQFRLPEILIFLAFFDKRFIPGLILGCLIANLFSPMLAYDVPLGTAATAIAVLLIRLIGKLTKERNYGLFLVPIAGALPNALLVTLAIHLAFHDPYWITALYVGAGEALVLLVGAVLFVFIRKIPVMKRFLHWNW